ncbi:hypothetical protein CYLTODRAFT_444337 [Cylindrobasidium torrendii FP15055 ss-10]|uniref:RRM domain-containing protein n=1 Tax=Cylindrobasidium torrendii FP15055 ss-10 TaxID=1314674 RepID=A0A0D7B8V5_9AGAR|nr:hypothetical protein CYLTODRAFT_444337 [Cylindrobasidium torrendii FP15055 ss-10]
MSGCILCAVSSASRRAIAQSAFPEILTHAAKRTPRRPSNAIAKAQHRRYASNQAGPSVMPSAKKWDITSTVDPWEDIEENASSTGPVRDAGRATSSTLNAERSDTRVVGNEEWSGKDWPSSLSTHKSLPPDPWEQMDTEPIGGDDAFVTSASFSGQRNMRYVADEEVSILNDTVYVYPIEDIQHGRAVEQLLKDRFPEIEYSETVLDLRSSKLWVRIHCANAFDARAILAYLRSVSLRLSSSRLNGAPTISAAQHTSTTGPSSEPPTMSVTPTVFVGNIPSSLPQSALRHYFAKYGQLKRVNSASGYAHFQFVEEESAVNAMRHALRYRGLRVGVPEEGEAEVLDTNKRKQWAQVVRLSLSFQAEKAPPKNGRVIHVSGWTGGKDELKQWVNAKLGAQDSVCDIKMFQPGMNQAHVLLVDDAAAERLLNVVRRKGQDPYAAALPTRTSEVFLDYATSAMHDGDRIITRRSARARHPPKLPAAEALRARKAAKRERKRMEREWDAREGSTYGV